MARILMAGLPAYGLANPTLPFAKAFVDAGHTVDFLMGSAFRERVERTGSRLIPFGGPDAITRPRQLLAQGRRWFDAMDASIRKLAPGYDVVVATGINARVPELERDLACPVIFLSVVFFQNDRVMRHMADIAYTLPTPMRRVMSTRTLRRLLVRPARRLLFGGSADDLVDLLRPRSSTLNITPASRLYQPFAEDFDTPTNVFAGPTPTQATTDDTFPLDRLREHDGPVLYATLGTVFNTNLGYFRAIAEAFDGSDSLVVITTGREASVADLGPMPSNVILRGFVPQTEVLRHASICFTHGGFGSATDTVLSGVPAVVTPMGADQFFNAHRLEELGAGRVLPASQVTPNTIRRIADEVLSTGPTPALADLRRSFDEAPGPAGAVRAVEARLGWS